MSVPEELVDRHAECDLLGCVFSATLALDTRPEHEASRLVLEEFATFDCTWICSRDLSRVGFAMQVVQRDYGAPIPLAVRDELRQRGHADEIRALGMLVTRSGAVISGWRYYVQRVGEVCARRREYLGHVNAAADLIAEGNAR